MFEYSGKVKLVIENLVNIDCFMYLNPAKLFKLDCD